MERSRVLIAEDGGAYRAALVRVLDEAGFEVEAYPEASSALERLTGEDGRPFDLLIVDIVMPVLSGLDLVGRMRQLLDAPPPVVFMSGQVRGALNDEAGTIDGDPILQKPFTPEELLAAVEEALA